MNGCITSARRLAAGVTAVLVLLAVSVALGSPGPAAADGPVLSRAHVVSFNIYGGNGNATQGFNTSATTYHGTNTVQTRLFARGTNTISIGLQEACQNQWNVFMIRPGFDGCSSGWVRQAALA